MIPEITQVSSLLVFRFMTYSVVCFSLSSYNTYQCSKKKKKLYLDILFYNILVRFKKIRSSNVPRALIIQVTASRSGSPTVNLANLLLMDI